MRILFAGTPAIAIPSLAALHQAGYTPVAVLTSPDAPQGRKRRIVASPVKEWALSAGIPVLQPVRLDSTAREEVARFQPELLVSVAYGRIFGPRFLELFERGGVNVHPSLLPRHRGPSPIQAAILAGDTRTGVTVQLVAREVDAGDILAQEQIPLQGDETSAELHETLAAIGARLLVRVTGHIVSGTEHRQPQNHTEATWCHLITREDGQLTWNESAGEVVRMVHAFTPWPGVRCRWGTVELQITEAAEVEEHRATDPDAGTPGTHLPGSVLGVDRKRGILVQTRLGIVGITRLKAQSRKEMDFRSFLNGHSTIIGSVLEQA